MENQKPDFLDRELIRLRREYSKDEVVSALNKKLSETEIELGKQKSYIDELEYEKKQKSLKNGGEIWFEKYTKLKQRFDKLSTEVKNEELYLNLKKENKRLNTELRRLRKTNSDLISKKILLENKINNYID